MQIPISQFLPVTMKTPKTAVARIASRVVFFAVLFGLMAVQVFAQKREYREAHVYVTAPATDTAPAQLLADCGFDAFAPLEQPNEHDPVIIIDDDKTFQTIEGFGGAFTDAAATVFGKLAQDAQEKFLKACFDPVEGNGYTLCRTTIHSCDYSGDMYTYDDTPGDKDLKNFTITHDLDRKSTRLNSSH